MSPRRGWRKCMQKTPLIGWVCGELWRSGARPWPWSDVEYSPRCYRARILWENNSVRIGWEGRRTHVLRQRIYRVIFLYGEKYLYVRKLSSFPHCDCLLGTYVYFIATYWIVMDVASCRSAKRIRYIGQSLGGMDGQDICLVQYCTLLFVLFN